MAKIYIVELTEEERGRLESMLRKGKSLAREQTRARILLQASEGVKDQDIAEALKCNVRTIERLRQRFVEYGFEAALHERPRPGAEPRLDDRQTAHLVALACSAAPEGYARWTLRLLADKMVEMGIAERVSYETVRQTLKKTNLSLGSARNGVSRPRGRRT
jgi:transposase